MKAMYEWFSINVIVVKYKIAQCQIILFLGVLHKHCKFLAQIRF